MATTERVQVDATDAIVGLIRLAGQVDRIAGDAGLDTAADAGESLRSALPRRSGALASSVSAEKVSGEARLSVGAEYAGWIIFGGTRGREYVAEGRYLGPALAGADTDWARRCTRGVEMAARRL